MAGADLLESAPADAFEAILFENVAYLAKPERRREAFDALRTEIGLAPQAILAAKLSALERITARGILKATFAKKLRECARLVLEEFDGDLDAALDGDLGRAKRALRKFPGIGEPGAEKILLFSGRHAFLAPDSNALRVLVRLGLLVEETSYARTYAGVRKLDAELKGDLRFTRELHGSLVRHGQQVCKQSRRYCGACGLRVRCPSAAV